jgi:hypothetical protein
MLRGSKLSHAQTDWMGGHAVCFQPRQTGWPLMQGVHASSPWTTSLKVNVLTSLRAVVAIPCAEETVVRSIDENGATVLNVICLPGLVGCQHRCALQACSAQACGGQQQVRLHGQSATRARARAHTRAASIRCTSVWPRACRDRQTHQLLPPAEVPGLLHLW